MAINIKPGKASHTNPKLTDLLDALDDVTTERDGWIAKCPGHTDSHASLRITVSETSGKVLLHDRAGCSTSKVLKAIDWTMADLNNIDIAGTETVRFTTSTDSLPDTKTLSELAVKLDGYASALHTTEGTQALDYAARRFGIEPIDAQRLGLGFSTDKGGPRLVVPFRSLDGQALGYQARSLLNTAQIRWAGPPNPDGASWTNVGYFPGSSGWPEVIITEGPGDALTAVATGFDAIGIRGAGLVSNSATIDELEEMLQGRVAVVAGDGDLAGKEFSAKLAEALADRHISVKVLPIPDGKDITDMRADDPAWFKQGFVKLVKETKDSTATAARLGGWDEEVYSLSDVGGARYLRDLMASQGAPIRYTEALGFLQYAGGVWGQRTDAQVRGMAHIVGDRLRQFAHSARQHATDTKNKSDVDKANRFMFYRDHAQSARGVDALIKELKSVAGVWANVEDFDRYPYYLAVRNGVVDLRTGDLLSHDPAYLLTRRIEHDYEPEARAVRWEQFVQEVFPDQPDMPAYLQRLVGYGITGSTDEQIFVVNYGTGSNGKSLFTDTTTEIFRSITTTTPFSTFEAKQSGGIPNDLAALKGARLVMASEGDQGKRMAEAVLKRITGRDLISARFLNREFFEFRPSFLLFMSSNYRPAFMGQDDGLWRRVVLLEWRKQFKGHEKDKQLADKLLAESAGILAWAVAGAVQWYAQGLNTPESVEKVTSNYRTQSDVLTGFFGGEWVKGEDSDWVGRTDLFRSFQDYAEAENMADLSKWSSRAFYRAVEERGYPAHKKNGVIGFTGLKKGQGAHFEEDEPAKMDVQHPTTALTGPSLEDL